MGPIVIPSLESVSAIMNLTLTFLAKEQMMSGGRPKSKQCLMREKKIFILLQCYQMF